MKIDFFFFFFLRSFLLFPLFNLIKYIFRIVFYVSYFFFSLHCSWFSEIIYPTLYFWLQDHLWKNLLEKIYLFHASKLSNWKCKIIKWIEISKLPETSSLSSNNVKI